jgi:tetratricopeptide (TPR) repeat protein
MGVTLVFYSFPLYLQGDGATAAKYLREALPYLETVGNSMMLGACWANLGIAHLLQGDYPAAAERVDKGLELQQRSGATIFLANFFWVKGWIETEDGRFTQARVHLVESLNLALANKDQCTEGIARIYLGRALSKEANPNYHEAEQSILRGMHMFEELGLKPWYAQGLLFLGELHADMGHRRKAQRYLKKAEDMFRDMGMDYWLKKTQALSERLKG